MADLGAVGAGGTVGGQSTATIVEATRPVLSFSTVVLVAGSTLQKSNSSTPSVLTGTPWPLSLPKPMMSGYSIKPENNVQRSEVDQGPAKHRRRFRTAPSKVSIKVILTTAEFGIFESFWRNDLYDGESWFYMPLVNGMGENTVRCRFTGPYEASAQANGFLFTVSGEVETLSLPVA